LILSNIILINGYRTGYPTLPAGIGYIAQAIEDAGFNYDVCDVNLQTHDQILQIIINSNPKYVGLGTMTYEVEKNYHLLASIHNLKPNIKIVLGGPQAIAAGEKIFQECHAVDIVVQGEGEESIVKILQGIELYKIPGVMTRDSHEVAIINKFLNVDSISFPKYNKFDLDKYGKTMQIASSRGCVYQCSFCGAPKFLGNKWRPFRLERMIEEFKYWYVKGYRNFYFSDSLFALNKKRVIDFCAYIVASNYKESSFTADGFRADHLDYEILQHMRRANFNSITIGVESVNDDTLRFFRKGESFSQIDEAISIADALGFNITVYLIIGAPEEAYNDAYKSIQYPKKYKNIVSAIYSKLMPILGTPYYDYAIEHKLVFDSTLYYPKIEAYGTNEKYNSYNAVENMWNSLYPIIEKTSRFLLIRNNIKKELNYNAFNNLSVNVLNILTYISSNRTIFKILCALIHIAKLIKLNRVFNLRKHNILNT